MNNPDTLVLAKRIHINAVNHLDNQLESFNRLLEKNGVKNTAAEKFIRRFMDWYCTPKTTQLLWEFLNESIYFEDLSILGNLVSFVVNLQDDTYFKIEWYYNSFEEERGDLIKVISTEDNPRAMPRLILLGEGSHDFQIILDTMDKIILRDEERTRLLEDDSY